MKIKKITAFISALAITVAFSACGKDSATPETVNSDANLSSDGNNFGNELKEASAENVTDSGSSTFNLDEQDYTIDITPIEPVKLTDATFNFDIEEIELNLSENLTEVELASIGELSEEEIKFIVETKKTLLADFGKIFDQYNIDVNINETSGEIVLDSSILFDTDKSDVSDEGKAFLKKFIPAYAEVICDNKYKDFIASVCVEGHTDTEGSHEYNQKLSQARADSVATYCTSDEIDISDSVRSQLNKLLKPQGFSFDKPVTDENGNVDMAASRRVSFRFMINI